MSKTVAIKIKNISKAYKKLYVLENVNYEFEYGNVYCIMGKSGSGKSTLINILGLMINPSSGEYFLNNKNIRNLSENQKASIRNREMGFVFQSFELVSTLNVLENVLLPTMCTKVIKTDIEHAKKILGFLGLKNKIRCFPRELSGGEQQRVAIARALINNPKIILADEPTGNLDIENEKMIFSILKELSMHGCCVIVATHSENIMNYTNNIIRLDKGKIVHDK